jgi:tyrosine-protein phosphatase YwqE
MMLSDDIEDCNRMLIKLDQDRVIHKADMLALWSDALDTPVPILTHPEKRTIEVSETLMTYVRFYALADIDALLDAVVTQHAFDLYASVVRARRSKLQKKAFDAGLAATVQSKIHRHQYKLPGLED